VLGPILGGVAFGAIGVGAPYAGGAVLVALAAGVLAVN